MNPDGMEARLSTLERDNRRLRVVVGCMVVIVLAAILGAADSSRAVLNPEAIIVGDRTGPYLSIDASGFALYDERGKQRAVLAAGKVPAAGSREGKDVLPPTGGAFYLADDEGTPRVGLAMVGSEPSVSVMRADGSVAATLIGSGDATQLMFIDGDGTRRATLGLSSSGSVLVLRDSKGAIEATVPP